MPSSSRPLSVNANLLTACILLRPPLIDVDGCLDVATALADNVMLVESEPDDPPGSLPRIAEALRGQPSEWIIWLEPCETLVCPDPAGLVRTLAAIDGPPALAVMVDEVPVGRLASPISAPEARIRRVSSLTRHGNAGADDIASVPFGLVRIVRSGALAGAFRSTDRQARSRWLQEANLLDPSVPDDPCLSLATLGRALWRAGRSYDALEYSTDAAESTDAAISQFAISDATHIALELGLTSEARRVSSRLRDRRDDPLPGRAALAARLEGEVSLASHEPERALELFERIEQSDPSQKSTEVLEGLASCKAKALVATGRHAEAAALLLDDLASPSEEHGHLAQSFREIVQIALDGGMRPMDIAARVPRDRLGGALTETLMMAGPTADELLEGFLARFGVGSAEHVNVLVAASILGTALPTERALAWSRRLREIGLQTLCPLMAVARDESFPGADRVLAALGAHRYFADPEAPEAMVRAAPACGVEDLDDVRRELAAGAPELLTPFDSARSSDPVVLHPLPAGSAPPEVSVIVLAYNRADSTAKCLEGIRATAPGDTSLEVVVVDNGSSDTTPALLAGQTGDLLAVRTATNLGFARGCNLGASIARGRILVFMNNDIIPLPGWLEPLIELLDSSDDVAAVGAKLVSPEGTVLHAGDRLIERRSQLDAIHLGTGAAQDAPEVSRRRDVASVTAAVLGMRSRDFRAMGGFNEGYWNGYEDVDLCLRVWHAGRRVVYEPRSVLIHDESATRGDARMRSLRGSLVAQRNLTLLNQRWLGKLSELADSPHPASGPSLPPDALEKGPVVYYQSILNDIRREPLQPTGDPPQPAPLVTVVLLADAPYAARWRVTIESLSAQIHQTWELLLASSNPADPIHEELRDLSMQEDRFIIPAFQSPGQALAQARGAYCMFLLPGEELDRMALEVMCRALESAPGAPFAYCDEDERHSHGHRAWPTFKPDWSPDLLLSVDYVSRASLYRTEVLRRSTAANLAFDPSLRYRLALQSSKGTDPPVHVALPLCTLSCPDAPVNGVQPRHVSKEQVSADISAVNDAIRTRGLQARVTAGLWPGSRGIHYDIPPDISALAVVYTPSQDLFTRCTESIEIDGFSTSQFSLEIMHVMSSSEDQALETINEIVGGHRCDVVVLIDGSLVATARDTLPELIAQAMRPELAAVGGQVIDSTGLPIDDGVTLGVGGLAIAAGRTLAPYLRSVVGERSAVSGSCMAFRRELFLKLGGLHDTIGSDLATIDFCVRARHRGYRVIHTPFARFRAPDLCAVRFGPDGRPDGSQEGVGIARTWPYDSRYTESHESDMSCSRIKDDPYYNRWLSRIIPFSLVGNR